MTTAYIYDALRTPRGRGKKTGSLYSVRPVELLAGALRAVRDRNDLDTAELDDVIVGCVTQTGEQGTCMAKLATLTAGYDESVPAVMANRFCASGLEAVHHGAALVASGFCDLVVSGGVDSMSRVTMGSDGGAMFDPALQWQVGSVPQGISADLLATLSGISRSEVDAFACASQERAVSAMEAGAFARSVVPVLDQNDQTILAVDEAPRAGTTTEALANLQPAFAMIGEQFGIDALTRRRYPQAEHIDHVHTAGNSSGIVDGAAAVLVGSAEKGEALGLKARGRIVASVVTGSEPLLMLTGTVPATQKVLAKAGLRLADIDLFEINEAFAAVPIWTMRELGIDHDKVNVNGGAIALGHPLGATGAMLLGTVLDALEDTGGRYGLVTLCVGGGMGIATIVERVD